MLSPERCLVVGETGTAQRLARALSVAAQHARIVASIECDSATSERTTFSDLSEKGNLARVIDSEKVDRLLVAPRFPDIGHVLPLVHVAKSIGVRVTLVPFLGEVVGASAELETVGGVSMLGLPQLDLSRSARIMKRGMDLIGATAGTSRGGAGDRARRGADQARLVGASALPASPHRPRRNPVRDPQVSDDGGWSRFAEGAADLAQRNGGLFKIADDPRVTRVGRFLRKTSLDELPQLWNVIRRDMSLVGPRPLVEDEDAKVVGWFRHRLRLQPGMTGPWQVLGSARVPLDDMIRIDYLYVANWSLWGDIKILLQTIPFVLARRGM